MVDTFSKRLRETREELGLSQNDMAKKLGVSRVTLTHYEAAERTPDIAFLRKLHKFTGISVYYFLGVSDFKNDSYINSINSMDLNEKALQTLSENAYYQVVLNKLLNCPEAKKLFKLSADYHDSYFLLHEDNEAGYEGSYFDDYYSATIGRLFCSLMKPLSEDEPRIIPSNDKPATSFIVTQIMDGLQSARKKISPLSLTQDPSQTKETD